jgi:hypothetical protein
MPAGKTSAAMMLESMVAIPSRMKIQRQPAKPPTPSILMMAVARRPERRIMKRNKTVPQVLNKPPNAPESEADHKSRENQMCMRWI